MVDLRLLADDALSRRQTTPTLVADALREAILRGMFKSGQPLPQDEIAAQFGLSRIPVREALRQLEGEGLVTFYPHRGAVVAHLSAGEVREICEIRVALETLAIRLAIPNQTEATLLQAERILDDTDRDVDVIGHWSENNWKFHSTLYKPANRPRLLKTIHGLHNNVDRYLRLHVSLMNYKDKGQLEHRQILDACSRHDANTATRLLEHHIDGVATLLSEYLE
jgi:DNA-binding GntR family transcriptional regulator